MNYPLEVIIPVYNEGASIKKVLELLHENVKTRFQVLICYDFEEDTTLPIIDECSRISHNVLKVKNEGSGVHGAIVTGFKKSTADCVIVFPADDILNQNILDDMYSKFQQGCHIVVASRFMKGGSMKGCPWLKAILVRLASFTLYILSSIPVRDASNGFRLFSRKIIDNIVIESSEGFTYSLELLVKSRRLGLKIGEVPAKWQEREEGVSRFRLFYLLPKYLKWYFYGLSTTWFLRKAETVKLKCAIE